jgi:tetratricopeptide (TPR) repeat protein
LTSSAKVQDSPASTSSNGSLPLIPEIEDSEDDAFLMESFLSLDDIEADLAAADRSANAATDLGTDWNTNATEESNSDPALDLAPDTEENAAENEETEIETVINPVIDLEEDPADDVTDDLESDQFSDASREIFSQKYSLLFADDPELNLPDDDESLSAIETEDTPAPKQESQQQSYPTPPDVEAVTRLQQDLGSDPHAQNLINQIETLRRQKASPMMLAHAYRTLGNLYRDRIDAGDASQQTLMGAMNAYEQVLHWLDEGEPMWAEVLNDMGNLCWLLSRSAMSLQQGLPSLQQGIQFYQVALTKISPQTHPQTYPMIQNNLGAAYGDLARYQDTAENLQRSIQAYQEALRYRKAEDDPMRYASTQNNLGTTYWNLAQHHEPRVHLKRAIAAYAEALRYYRPEQEPLNYAMIQNNLGTAYWNLAQYEQPQDWLALALGAYRMALKYRTLDKAPSAFAATQNNLGTAYWNLASHTVDNPATKQDYLERAIAAYEGALMAVAQLAKASAPIPLNFDVSATYNNLGLVHFELATDAEIALAREGWSKHLQAALQYHVVALQGWEQKPDLRQAALQCIVHGVRAFLTKGGLEGQNLALSKLPGTLLPEILPKL